MWQRFAFLYNTGVVYILRDGTKSFQVSVPEKPKKCVAEANFFTTVDFQPLYTLQKFTSLIYVFVNRIKKRKYFD